MPSLTKWKVVPPGRSEVTRLVRHDEDRRVKRSLLRPRLLAEGGSAGKTSISCPVLAVGAQAYLGDEVSKQLHQEGRPGPRFYAREGRVKTGDRGVKNASRSRVSPRSSGELAWMDEIQEPALRADVGLPGKSGYAHGVNPDPTDFRWPGPSRRRDRRRRGLTAPLALPAGFGALLVVGAVAAASHGGLSAGWVLLLAAIIVAVGAAVAEPAVAPVLGAIGWLTVAGFSRAPYAEVQVSAPGMARAALVIAACTVGGVAVGVIVRQLASSFTLWIVDVSASQPAGDQLVRSEPANQGTVRRQRRIADLSGGIGVRRVLVGVLLAVAGLPLLTLALSAHGLRLDLGDDLLIYLVAVVAVAVVGGFWSGRAGCDHRQPAGQLVFHAARPHPDDRRRQEPAGAAAIRDCRCDGSAVSCTWRPFAPGRLPGVPRKPRTCWR